MDVIIATAIIAAVVGLAIGIVAGYFTRKNISEAKIGEADSLAKNIIDQANKDAETIKKEKLLEAKEEIHKFRNDAEKENRETVSSLVRRNGFPILANSRIYAAQTNSRRINSRTAFRRNT